MSKPSAPIVSRKGFGSAALYSRMKRLMAAWRSMTEWNTPFLSRRRVSFAKKPSTALSHEHEVGVKWNVPLGKGAEEVMVGNDVKIEIDLEIVEKKAEKK